MVLYPVPGAVGSTQLPSFSVSGVCHTGSLRSVWVLRDCSKSGSVPWSCMVATHGEMGQYELGPRSAGTCYGYHQPWWHILGAGGPLKEYMVDSLRAVETQMLETALEVWSL